VSAIITGGRTGAATEADFAAKINEQLRTLRLIKGPACRVLKITNAPSAKFLPKLFRK
jgi:hypothetical protein